MNSMFQLLNMMNLNMFACAFYHSREFCIVMHICCYKLNADTLVLLPDLVFIWDFVNFTLLDSSAFIS